MSSEVKNFIDKIQKNDNAGAGEAFKDALRAKVGDALDNHRKDVASTMFSGTPGQTTPEAVPHSDPKPEVAGTGTFTPDGQVVPTGADAVADTGTADVTQNAGE